MSIAEGEVRAIRAFVAVEINERVRREVAEAQALLGKTRAHVSWVPAANIHLSLDFLGDIYPDTADLVAAAMDDTAAVARPFRLEVAGIGTFGSRRSPRVVWAGIRECRGLMEFQARLHGLLQELGLGLDNRSFKPHLTLGRVRSARGRSELLSALEEIGDRSFGTADAGEAVLMQSRLKPEGAEYTALHRARFDG
jgi:2'-5' RNA ligase